METAVLTTLSGLSITSNITEKVIINTIQNSFSLVKRFVSFQHEQIKEVLSEHDLISKLEIIQALMSDIEEDKKSIQKQSIQKSLTNLHFVVEEIHRLMENIDNKIKYHQTKYFSTWRSLNYEDEIKKLKRYIQLMDTRYQMFLEVLKVR